MTNEEKQALAAEVAMLAAQRGDWSMETCQEFMRQAENMTDEQLWWWAGATEENN